MKSNTYGIKVVAAPLLMLGLAASAALGSGPYTITDLGTFGGSSSFAIGVNDAGQVVGSAYTSGDAAQRPFLWSAGGGMVDLGSFGGSGDSAGFGINAAGQVSGWAQDINEDSHAFCWSQSTGMVDLGSLPGCTRAQAFGINAAGQVVGMTENQGTHAVLWENVGGQWQATDLNVAGLFGSFATGINDSGQAVGLGLIT